MNAGKIILFAVSLLCILYGLHSLYKSINLPIESKLNIILKNNGNPDEEVSSDVLIWKGNIKNPIFIFATNGYAEVKNVKVGEKITYMVGKDGKYYHVRGSHTIQTRNDTIIVYLDCIPNEHDILFLIDKVGQNPNEIDAQITIDNKNKYCVIKDPILCIKYDGSVVDNVEIPILKKIDTVSDYNQCFDLGISNYVYNYPELVYFVRIYTKNTTHSNIEFCLLDKDLWYVDGNMYAINPITNESLGSKTDWCNSLSIY